MESPPANSNLGLSGEDCIKDTMSIPDSKISARNDVRQIALDGRPEWPYETWKYERTEEPFEASEPLSVYEVREDCDLTSGKHRHSSDNEQEDGNKSPSSSSLVTYEPDHWDEDWSEKLDDSIPIQRIIQYLMPQMSISEDLFQNIRECILGMMNKTADEIGSLYTVFERCYVLPVGSAEEGTKIASPDEFDFAVILPYFDTFDKLLMVIYERDENTTYSDPEFSAIVNEMSMDGYENTIKANFQGALKFIWTQHMEKHIPEGWVPLGRKCYTKDESIAGTFHFLRSADNFIVDVDVCFWTLLNKSSLEKPSTVLPHRNYIMKHFLDDDQKIYAVLPTDYRIEYELNVIRFAMSSQESNELNKYGPCNGRIKSYKLAKCISKLFLPKIAKHKDCDRCLDPMVSSFCLKNIVFFMARYHTDDALWTDDQLGNRLKEIFAILNFCIKVNQSIVSAFFIPYSIQLNISDKFNPTEHTMCSINNLCSVRYMVDGVDVEDRSTDNAAHLPDMKISEKWCEDDPVSKKLLTNYFDYMTKEEWSLAHLIDRLNELLSGLRQKEETDRKEIADQPGCLCFEI